MCAKETKTKKPENHFEKLCGVKESGRRMVDFSTRNLFYVRTVSPIEKKERNTKKYKFSTCIHSTHRHTRNKRSFNVASKQQQQPVPNVFMSNIKRALWLNRLYLYIYICTTYVVTYFVWFCVFCVSASVESLHKMHYTQITDYLQLMYLRIVYNIHSPHFTATNIFNSLLLHIISDHSRSLAMSFSLSSLWRYNSNHCVCLAANFLFIFFSTLHYYFLFAFWFLVHLAAFSLSPSFPFIRMKSARQSLLY